MAEEENRLQLDMAAVEKRRKRPRTVDVVFGVTSRILPISLVNARIFTTEITKTNQSQISTMNTDNTTEQSSREVVINLINNFLKGELRERWLYFARMKKIPWEKFDPYAVYVGASSNCIAAQPLNCKTTASVIEYYQLQEIKNVMVWVLSTGHGAKGASRLSLDAALSGKFPLEGFIIVHPDKLVICLGHHGDAWVLAK